MMRKGAADSAMNLLSGFSAKSMKHTLTVLLLVSVLLFAAWMQADDAHAAAGSKGTVVIEALNVRSGAGTLNEALGMVYMGDTIEILGSEKDVTGTIWYMISYNGSIGYVSSDYVLLKSNQAYIYDAQFEAELTAQGFPESYKDYLRQLHADYPNWVFKAAQTGLDWNAAVDKESGPGVTLVTGNAAASWKSMEEGAYNFETGKYIQYDSGNWVTASRVIIEHYMDPRNFLTPEGIFQFMAHSYDANTQTAEGLQSVLDGTFMSGLLPDETGKTYNEVLMEAGMQNNVNPYVLASMILVEQGSTGVGKSISGTVSGYEGYYNYFNVGAYKAGGMDAVTRGLWYASQSGSYYRPWNSIYNAIFGGAAFYSENYVQSGQDTLYLKKFNVMNGLEKVGKGQYMTNVQGAESEAAALCRGYLGVMNQAMTFIIPVYQNMPDTACLKPVSSANNNNYLTSIAASGEDGVILLTPSFSEYLTTYNVEVPAGTETVFLQASASSSDASVSGAGLVALEKGAGTQSVDIVVTAASGAKRVYTVNIIRVSEDPDGSIRAAVKATEIKASSLQSGASKMRLTWTVDTEADLDYYVIHRSVKKSSGYGTKPYYTTKDASVFMYTNSKDLEKGKTYYFKMRGVRMIDGVKVYTPWSNKTWKTIKAFTGPEYLDASVLKGIQESTVALEASLNDAGKARLDWTKSPGYKVDYYEVYRADGTAGMTAEELDFGETPYYKTSSGTKKYYVNSKNLKDGMTIYYKVRGVRADGPGLAYTQWSDIMSVTIGEPVLPEDGTGSDTPVIPDDSVIPDGSGAASGDSAFDDPDGSLKAAVEALTIDMGSSLTEKGKIRLDWTLIQAADNGAEEPVTVDYYEVFRSTERFKGYGTSAYFTSSGADKNYYVNTKGLESGRTYYYKVRGVRLIDGEKVYTQWSNKSWRTAK